MLKGYCLKKRFIINDRKVWRYCFRVKCQFLKLQIWRLERKLKRRRDERID